MNYIQDENVFYACGTPITVAENETGETHVYSSETGEQLSKSDLKFGKVFGGGKDITVKNTNVVMKSGFLYLLAGGGERGCVEEDVNVKLEEGMIGGYFFGGGVEDKIGSVNVEVSGGAIKYGFFGVGNSLECGNVNGGFDFELVQNEVLGQLDYISDNHPDIKITRDGDNLWYAADIEGAKFIFLSTPEEKAEGDKHTYTVSAKQLAFLDKQLYEGEQSNKTAFVVSHVPLSNYIPAATSTGFQTGITNTSAIEEILSRHPNTLFCTGHSHSDLGDDKTNFVVAGNMITKFTHMNDGCLVWLDPTDGIGEDGTTSSKITSHSAGMYVEVYNDMIVLMGRKFMAESKYFGNCLYVIPTQDSERDVVKASISGELKVGETLTAHISEQGEYTYNWIVDGITVSTKNTYTVGEGLEDKYVYLRVIDKDGYYATVKSDVPVGTEKVTFGNAEGKTVKTLVELEKQTTDCVVAVAVYDENDKMISLKFVYTNPSNIFVKVDKTLGAEYVKAFTLRSLSSLKPLIENTKTYLS